MAEPFLAVVARVAKGDQVGRMVGSVIGAGLDVVNLKEFIAGLPSAVLAGVAVPHQNARSVVIAPSAGVAEVFNQLVIQRDMVCLPRLLRLGRFRVLSKKTGTEKSFKFCPQPHAKHASENSPDYGVELKSDKNPGGINWKRHNVRIESRTGMELGAPAFM